MKVKRNQLLQLWKVMEALSGGKALLKFSYFIAKNHNILKSEIDILEKLRKPSEEYQKYDQRRADLAKSLSDKDKDGKPIIENDTYVLKKNKLKFDKELKLFRKESQKVVEEFEKQIDEFNKMLNEEVEFKGYKIKLENLPEKIEPQLIELFMLVDILDD